MRILLIGAISFPGGLAGSYLCALSDASQGLEISTFDIDKEIPPIPRSWVLHDQLVHRMGRRLYHYVRSWSLDWRLAKRIRGNEYKDIDLIVDVGSWWLTPRTLSLLKEKTQAPVFHITGDSPFDQHNTHPNLIRCLPLYDCYFTWNKSLRSRLKKHGVERVEYLPFAWDPHIHPAFISAIDEASYRADITFVGAWTPERETLLARLTDFDLAIWGDLGWRRVDDPSSGLAPKWRERAVRCEEFAKVCVDSKINLNFLRDQNKGSHNMRTFEVPGCGGFLLTERSEEQCEFFEEGKEIACFSTPEELREKIECYLPRDSLRKEMARAAHEKVEKHHTYLHRARRVLEVYKEMRG